LRGLNLVEQWGLRRNRHATLLFQTNQLFRPNADYWGSVKPGEDSRR
jgi:hypothetical protein